MYLAGPLDSALFNVKKGGNLSSGVQRLCVYVGQLAGSAFIKGFHILSGNVGPLDRAPFNVKKGINLSREDPQRGLGGVVRWKSCTSEAGQHEDAVRADHEKDTDKGIHVEPSRITYQ